MIKIEDIVLGMLIISIIAMALWLLSGSPPETDALITLAFFVAASDLLVWRKIFSIDKNTTVGFVKVKHDIDRFRIEVNDRFNSIDNKLDKIEKKIK